MNLIVMESTPETGDIDYEEVKSLAEEHQPKLIICGFSAFRYFRF